jgi:small nuclear ribonucleoprotein
MNVEIERINIGLVSKGKLRMSEEGIATQLLQESIGKNVLVKLKGRRSVRGKIKGFDKQMNIVITDATEIIEQQGNNNNSEKKEQEQESQVGDALIRGDNVITIAVL